MNQRLFWHYVNHHRKRSCNAAGANINFDGRNVLNEREINNKWANFFASLYKPFESPKFDDSFKQTFFSYVQSQNEPVNTNDIVVSSEEVESAVRLAHKGKAYG